MMNLIWLLAIVDFQRLENTTLDESNLRVVLADLFRLLRTQVLNKPLIAQYEQHEIIGFGGDEQVAQMALRRGIQGARRMRSVQFGPGAIVPALFTHGWPTFMQELEEMCNRLLFHSRNPYSTMRVTITYSKRLKYSWQMHYWGN